MRKQKHESVYWTDEAADILDKLTARYPGTSRSAFASAAVRLYWQSAQRGLDANLEPLTADRIKALHEELIHGRTLGKVVEK